MACCWYTTISFRSSFHPSVSKFQTKKVLLNEHGLSKSNTLYQSGLGGLLNPTSPRFIISSIHPSHSKFQKKKFYWTWSLEVEHYVRKWVVCWIQHILDIQAYEHYFVHRTNPIWKMLISDWSEFPSVSVYARRKKQRHTHTITHNRWWSHKQTWSSVGYINTIHHISKRSHTISHTTDTDRTK